MRNFFLLSFVLLINMHCTSQTTNKFDTGTPTELIADNGILY